MTPSLRAAAALLLCTMLAACAGAPTPSPAPAHAMATPPVPVVLVSIDGFRADYLDRGITPTLSRIAREGVRGDGMTPSYPSLTFPNHYTLVTGLRPDRHGVVQNTMRDAVLGPFKSSNEANAGDARWWNGGEPLWVTAERAGVRTATMFWPGSQAPIHGVHPREWVRYDKTLGNDARVDQVVTWLRAPEAERPRLVTLYFETLDVVGHDFGPDSPEMARAIASVDASLARLVDALGPQVNLVIVSDHGMAAVPPGQLIAVEDMVDPADAEVIATGQSVGFAPRAGRARAAEAQLLGAHPDYECWKKSGLPARWHYGSNPRVPPIVCQVEAGWDAIHRADFAKRPAHARGSHGYDPALPVMRALFVARGPAFRAGARLPVFDNVDVYPLLARLIDVPPLPNDGTIAPLLPALK